MAELASIFARIRENSGEFCGIPANSAEFAFAFRANSRVFARIPPNSREFVFFFWSRFWPFFACFRQFFHFFIACPNGLKENNVFAVFRYFSRFFAFRFTFFARKLAKNGEKWRKTAKNSENFYFYFLRVFTCFFVFQLIL